MNKKKAKLEKEMYTTLCSMCVHIGYYAGAVPVCLFRPLQQAWIQGNEMNGRLKNEIFLLYRPSNDLLLNLPLPNDMI